MTVGRILISGVAPASPEHGPARAILGDRVAVGATVIREGHDLLAARARWRRRGERAWRTAPLTAGYEDRYTGTFVPGELGDHEVEIEAWTDRFATWRRDLATWMAAGDDVDVELEVGSLLVLELAAGVPAGERRRLADAAAIMADRSCTVATRVAAGLDDELARILDRPDPRDLTRSARTVVTVERERAVYGAWYEFFPRSEGGFAPGPGGRPAGAVARLDAVASMGFDVVYLPPIHPIGTTHRKGPGNTLVAGPGDPGSPWAIGSPEGGHDALHPDLGTLDDFDAFVARATELGLEVALDLALQCSPDHPWVRSHPEWFRHRPDGSIRYAENPPKRYQDIYPLEFRPTDEAARASLWAEVERIVRHWMAHGVRIFRVDNPHTKPLALWEWLIARIHATDPDVVFLAEAFTAPAMMHSLAEVGFSQSYTYFTWRTAGWELRQYLDELQSGPASGWFRPNFWPTTPDILSGPLRNGSRQAFEIRLVLASLLSPSYGLYSGYELEENRPQSDTNEEFAGSEKYQVVRRDWAAAERAGTSLAPLITELNRIRRSHPAVRRLRHLRLCDTDHPDVLAWLWSDHDPDADPEADPAFGTGPGVGDRARPETLLVVVNLDPDTVAETNVHVDLGALGIPWDAEYPVLDQLTGERWEWRGPANYVRLDPSERVAHVLALDPAPRPDMGQSHHRP